MEVQIYYSSAGTYYVSDFISSRPDKDKKKIMRNLELVENYGFNFVTHSGTMKKLHGYKLYEIVIKYKVGYRIFCVIREKTCWLLHIFIKKSNSTPRREIETALQRARDLDIRFYPALAI